MTEKEIRSSSLSRRSSSTFLPQYDPLPHRPRTPPPAYESICQERRCDLSPFSDNSYACNEMFFSETSVDDRHCSSQRRMISRRSRGSSGSCRRMSNRVVVDSASRETFDTNNERLKQDDLLSLEEIQIHVLKNLYPDPDRIFLEDKDGVTYAVTPSVQSGKVLHYALLPLLTEDNAREIFIKRKSKRNFYLCDPRKYLRVVRIRPQSAWKYNLESTVEERWIVEAEEPCRGEISNTAERRRKNFSSKWNISVEVPKNLSSEQTEQKYFKVRNTSTSVQCSHCTGLGHKLCEKCEGKGDVVCYYCYGNCHFKASDMHCFECFGRGRTKCCHCHGRKNVSCRKCEQTGNLETYKQLNVEWHTYTDDHYSTKSNLCLDFLRTCKGEIIFKNRSSKEPISQLTTDNCLNMKMISASGKLIKEHQIKADFRGARIREQKQVVSVIPVFEVKAEWKKKPITFWIAGTNMKIYYSKSSNSRKLKRYNNT